MIIKIIKKILPNLIKKILLYLVLSTPSAKRKKFLQTIKQEEEIKKTSKIINKIYGDQEITVLNGPFKGMKYVDLSIHSKILPKLVGSYEEPIHKWIYEILKKKCYSTIINIGCAEGYYAVGFSKAISKPKILAFDINKEALLNANKLAQLNSASSVITFGEKFDASVCAQILGCDPASKILIFADIEGAELDLLNTKQTPDILNCDILVELHDCFYPGLTEIITNRFQASHKIEIVADYPWRSKDYNLMGGGGEFFSEEDWRYLLNENRPKAMRWMYAKLK
jgi:hypothetical protein